MSDAHATPAASAASVQPPPGNGAPFGAALEPVLRQACHGRLSTINWFRTDWQRGGALTGYATLRDASAEHPVVVKLPVPPVERQWLGHLQDAEDAAPRVFADGDVLGGYDMAWVVMERLPHGPISSAWGGEGFDLMAAAIARFAAAAQRLPVTGRRRGRDFEAICKHARDAVLRHGLGPRDRWKKALKAAQKKLRQWLAVRDEAGAEQWCHGDFHFGNAMTRLPAPQGPAILFDFAEVHRGHWVEDAVYFEHFFWSQRQRLDGRKLCSLIAKARRANGLEVNADWPRFAEVQRGLLALSAPVMLEHEGNQRHLRACLELLEAQAA